MAPLKVELHYDIGSPKSWVALELLLRYAPVWNLQLELFPGLLGAVYQLTGNAAPATNPFKAAHGPVDLGRQFAENKLEGSVPGFFGGPEHNFLGVARFLRAVKASCDSDTLNAATRILFTQCWTKHIPPTSPEFFAGLVPGVFSEAQLKQLLAKANAKENKEGLKGDAQALVEEHGAFGFPWIVVHMPDGRKESFFGADRMEAMAFVLGPKYKYSGPFPQAQSKL
ncbi:thioredoxin-like protein [Auricularia subglabra TFB-10046 SS5]|nr:thioredoxin-like protein [Auricularia subglabra TFB-10046 SS5]